MVIRVLASAGGCAGSGDWQLADLHARRRLAGTQYHRDRSTRRRIIDMDRQEAALIIMGVQLRQLLMAVHNIDRVVDVQDTDRGGFW